jgi:hypothetical protein
MKCAVMHALMTAMPANHMEGEDKRRLDVRSRVRNNRLCYWYGWTLDCDPPG